MCIHTYRLAAFAALILSPNARASGLPFTIRPLRFIPEPLTGIGVP